MPGCGETRLVHRSDGSPTLLLAAVRTYTAPNGKTFPNAVNVPNTIEISELFQIRDGKIDQIEAVINSVPYRMRSDVWDK